MAPPMNVAQEFEPIYRAAQALPLGDGQCHAALVTIVRTHGSTFRRAGTSMLVLRDGTLICELSGGCPQRDIALRAQHAMASGQPSLVAYGRDANYDVMIETGCGGELEVLIEPWSDPASLHFLDAIERLRARRDAGTMATVYTLEDGVVRRPRRLVRGVSTDWDDFDEPSLKQPVIAALETMGAPHANAATRHVEAHGRRYNILLETLRPPDALIVIGDSAAARILAELAYRLGWQTTLVSADSAPAAAIEGVRRVAMSPAALTATLAFDARTSVVVMTHRLALDLAYLGPLLNTSANYIGVIGSRQRAQQIRAAFPATDDRVHVPAGLDVGSETPAEIALAIAAEILAIRNGRRGGSLAHSHVPIHP